MTESSLRICSLKNLLFENRSVKNKEMKQLKMEFADVGREISIGGIL